MSWGEGHYVLRQQHPPPRTMMKCCVITCRQVVRGAGSLREPKRLSESGHASTLRKGLHVSPLKVTKTVYCTCCDAADREDWFIDCHGRRLLLFHTGRDTATMLKCL